MNAAFRRTLVAWFRDSARDLPWRHKPTPYRVWVSEVMLQQTRVEAVREHFNRFMRRFPSVRKLAAADLEDVLQAWSGLGYYRRARMLHGAAREIVQKHGGRVPREHQTLLALPGIGRYTAGAILSIAFNQPQPIVDGNVKRVHARLSAGGTDPWSFAEHHVLRGAAEGLSPSALNQALMELGATVCTPRTPRCESCPVSGHCKALAADSVDQHPRQERRARPLRRRYLFAGVKNRRGDVLMVRRDEVDRSSLLPGGLWEFPHCELTGDVRPALKLLGRQLAAELRPQGDAASRSHSIMHHKLELIVIPCSAGRGRPRGTWLTPAQARAAAIASATRKLLDAICGEE